MKNGLYIFGVFAFLLVFTACEKCEKPVTMSDPFATIDDSDVTTRGGESDKDNTDAPGLNGDITDPEEDEDFDGIVDPEEDEDFDSEGK